MTRLIGVYALRGTSSIAPVLVQKMFAAVVLVEQDCAFQMEPVGITVTALRDMNQLIVTVMQYSQGTQVYVPYIVVLHNHCVVCPS